MAQQKEFIASPTAKGAFCRSTDMAEKLAWGRDNLSNKEFPLFIEQLGEYKSHGHGGKHKAKSAEPKPSNVSPSRYQPHQGKQEVARRLAQQQH